MNTLLSPPPARPQLQQRRRRPVVGSLVAAAVITVVVAATLSLVILTEPAVQVESRALVPLPDPAGPERQAGTPGRDAGQPHSADGELGNTSVGVDSDHPTVTRLDPALHAAVIAAAKAAATEGVEVRITSGWRSATFQQRLLDAAITRYGSLAQARRWVQTPEGSRHVTGDAVDVGPTDAAYWMDRHGAEFGLCRTYANEIWHYELVTTPGGTCPAMKPDATS